MGGLAGLASQVLSGVTSQIGSYFASPSTLPRQYIVPSVGFVLACIGLSMVVLGPAVPGGWWDELGPDVKLLITALGVIAFVLVTEISRNLAQLVRRLYSGTWPTVSWWQEALRRPHLDRRLGRNLQAYDLDRAAQSFTTLRKLLGDNVPARAVADLPAAAELKTYPVLRGTLTPFRAISMADLSLEKCAPVAAAAVSVVDVVGRYAAEPIPGGKPIPLDLLRTPPDPRFLAGDRRVVSVPIPPLKDAPFLQAGAVVALRVSSVDCYSDLLVLDRSSESHAVLAVPTAAADRILNDCGRRSVCFFVESVHPTRFEVVPIARVDVSAGQLLSLEHVEWQARGYPNARTSPRLLEADVLGRAFWPRGDAFAPAKTVARLPRGSELTAPNLIEVRDPAWLNGDRVPRAVPWSAATAEATIRTGDVIAIRDGGRTIAEDCFVFEVTELTCFAAVKRSAPIIPAQPILSPLRSIPALGERLGSDVLIVSVTSALHQRANELPAGTCLADQDVLDRYSQSEGWLAANAPILGAELVRAYPADAVLLRLCPERRLGRQIRIRGSSRPRPGDLVTVTLHTGDTCYWRRELLFVRSIVGGVGNAAHLEVLVQSEWDRANAQNVWRQGDMTASVRVTHSDEIAVRKLENLKQKVTRESELPRFNRALSEREPNTLEICDRAPVLADLVFEIRDHQTLLRQRPWSTTVEAGPRRLMQESTRLLGQIDGIVAMWQDLIKRLRDNIERAALVDLPGDPSEVRPTALGNVLAAAAAYPWRAYGIDTGTILPKLLTILSADAPSTQRFRGADETLDLLLLSSFWASVWAGLSLFAGVVAVTMLGRTDFWIYPAMSALALAVAWLMREAALAQAYAYADAAKSIFDLERHQLLPKLGVVVEDQVTSREESDKYWKPLYRWFAFGEHNDGLKLKTSVVATDQKAGASASKEKPATAGATSAVADVVAAARNGKA